MLDLCQFKNVSEQLPRCYTHPPTSKEVIEGGWPRPVRVGDQGGGSSTFHPLRVGREDTEIHESRQDGGLVFREPS